MEELVFDGFDTQIDTEDYLLWTQQRVEAEEDEEFEEEFYEVTSRR